MEEYVQPPILFDGGLDSIHAQPAGQLSQILVFHFVTFPFFIIRLVPFFNREISKRALRLLLGTKRLP